MTTDPAAGRPLHLFPDRPSGPFPGGTSDATPGQAPGRSRDAPRGAALAEAGRIPPERVALVDLLDRLLAGGVVVSGDLVLSIADIDLVRISLRALIMSVREPDPVERGRPG